MIIGIILGILAILFFYYLTVYNLFIKLQNRSEEAFATMDVYLKNRWDLIPNLVEIVKGYATHEKDTLESVIKARNLSMKSSNREELKINEQNLTAGLKSIFALIENYPDLKANQSFLKLQNQLEKIEKDILNSRKYFNAIIREFNTKIEIFPNSLIANILHLKKKNYFEIDDSERQNVKIDL